MAKQTAGILVYRRRKHGVEVFLAHPGGPYWAKKDLAAWSIPKGEFLEPETPLDAAKREFAEEIGQSIDGDFMPLTVDYNILPEGPSPAFAGLDFAPPSSSFVTFEAGSATATLTFDALDDTIVEGPESFRVVIALDASVSYTVGAANSAIRRRSMSMPSPVRAETNTAPGSARRSLASARSPATSVLLTTSSSGAGSPW